MFQSCAENQNTFYVKQLFFFSIMLFLKMWKNKIEPDRTQMTIWRMRIACFIPKTTNTHTNTICNTHCFSTTTMVSRTRLIVTPYVPCLCWDTQQQCQNVTAVVCAACSVTDIRLVGRRRHWWWREVRRRNSCDWRVAVRCR